MEMTGEMMDDALEGALGGDSDLEGETADVMAQASGAHGMAGQGRAGLRGQHGTAHGAARHTTQHSTAQHQHQGSSSTASGTGQDRTGLPACEEANDRESSGAEGKEEGRLCGMAPRLATLIFSRPEPA